VEHKTRSREATANWKKEQVFKKRGVRLGGQIQRKNLGGGNGVVKDQAERKKKPGGLTQVRLKIRRKGRALEELDDKAK